MNDTHPEIENLIDTFMKAKSGEQKLLMAASMFDASRMMAMNSILARHPDITPGKLRAELLKRTYSGDIAPFLLAKIASQLEMRDNPGDTRGRFRCAR
ncbi:hypothetical protein [Syntrophothermus lipocalidus]|uniref:Uncharacterized protein n=1 Tax=Syntrophothermus lipocalidus (strain DSM 12680 / TGB-C1) TaxID=643648 RepID=D7CPL4_SYNLT|nr:hypothetical protein [Syntrophothermus lipocalidus]ADI02649.1 hypothetical protein Slip_1895 [Syntrophothermus lipocalidus DSM 12680]